MENKIVWIVYDKGRYNNKRKVFAKILQDNLISYGIKTEIVLTNEIKNRKDLPFLVIMRSAFKTYSKYFESKNIKTVNSYNVSKIFNDKWKSYLFFKENNIRCMETYLYSGEKEVQLKYPLIIKSRYGHGGTQVYMCNNFDELQKYFKIINNKTAIIQPLATKLGIDKRIFILGNEIKCAVKRVNNNSFKSNYSLGGNVVMEEISQKEKNIVNQILNNIYFDFAGIDFIYNGDKVVVNEIEDVVGCRMLYATSNIDIGKLFVDYIVRRYINEK